ncbi:MAG: hypothetical protein U0R80_16110 [Nocardioidaceae bacterium]
MKQPPPVVALLVLAPFIGEVMSTSTPITSFVLPWTLLFEGALYGGGALLVREVVRSRGWGLAGFVALGAAYGVFEEAVLVRSWFAPEFLEAHRDYSRVWQTSLLQAVHLTAFHVVVSIGCSVALVEWLHPGHRHLPWVGRRGLAVASVGLVALAALSLLAPEAFFPVPWPQVGAAAALTAGLVLVAPRLPRRWPATGAVSRRVFAGAVAACLIGHFALVWSAPALGVPWPWGLGLAAATLLVGWAVATRLSPGSGAERLSGLVLGLGWPLVLLNLLVGLGGRLDCLLTAAVTAVGLVWVARRHSTRVLPADAPR